VALQGSIDTFALDDVLRLVASTAKTGRLSLRGTRGQGELVVLDGRLLDGSVTTDHRVGDLYELVFEMLRFEDGDFQFDAEDVDGIEGVEAAEVEDVLNGAAELLAEWREIERVVPSGRAAVRLLADGPGGTVKIEPAQWGVVAAVGSGASVHDVAEQLDASNLAIGRLLRSLVEAGLVGIDEIEESSVTEPAPEPVAEVGIEVDDAVAEAPVDEWAPPADEPSSGFAPFAVDDPWAEPRPMNGNGNGNGSVDADILFDTVHEPSPDPGGFSDSDPFAASEQAPAVDAAEFARRLAELPPRAAKAVAAAARATNAEERQAALAELDGTGEEVDHEVLLQLLGPVD
jgi:Domain of unknown function (DUF4388)